MRLLPLSQVTGVEYLAQSLFDLEGRKLLSAGVLLSPNICSKLREKSIVAVYVDDEFSEGIEVVDVVDEETRLHAKLLMRNQMVRIAQKKDPDLTELVNIADKMLQDIFVRKVGLINIQDIRTRDESLFSHSVNVAILSIMLATKLGYTKPKVSSIGLGALLHDIGKKVLPDRLLSMRPENMTPDEFTEYKMHPILGYNILKSRPEIPATTKISVLMHHEHISGNGFPMQITTDKIHYSARIVGICDSFDVNVYDPDNDRVLKTTDAIELLTDTAGYFYDKEFVATFLKMIPVYPNGTLVLLSNGWYAIVVQNNEINLTRPLVRALYNPVSKIKFQNYVIDLMQDLSLKIIREIRHEVKEIPTATK